MSFALQGAYGMPSVGATGNSARTPVALKPPRVRGDARPSIAYRRRVSALIGGTASGRYHSSKFQDWHLVKKQVPRKFVPGMMSPDADPDQLIEQERIEYIENAGDPLPVPIDAPRKKASELQMRLAYLRYHFGKWDGVTTDADVLATADSEWRQVQRNATTRLQSLVTDRSPTDKERVAAEKFLKVVGETTVAELIPAAGETIKVLEYEAHAVLPGYHYRTTDVVKGSLLQGDKSQLNIKLRPPNAVLTAEYNAQFGAAGWEFGYEMAVRAYKAAEQCAIIDVVLGDTTQTELDRSFIQSREDGKAEQAAARARSKSKKAAEGARAAAAAAAGDAAHDDLRADTEGVVRDGEEAAAEAGAAAKKARKEALTAEQKAENLRKKEEQKELEAQQEREKQAALEAEASQLGLTVDALRNKKRAEAGAATRKLRAAEAAGFATAEEYEENKKQLKEQQQLERDLKVEIDRLIRKVEKEAEKAEKERLKAELEANRKLQQAYQERLTEMYRLQGAWDEEDLNAYAHRQGLLNRMAELRFMFENLAQWTRECNDAWAEADADDERVYGDRVDWFNANVAQAAEGARETVPPVPRSLKMFYDPYTTMRMENGGKIPAAQRLEAEPLSAKPHWFDSMSTAVQASAIAWESAKTGAPPRSDQTTSGGRALSAIYEAISDTKAMWRPSKIDVGSFEPRVADVAFDWDSRGYSERLRKDGELRDAGQHGTVPTIEASKYRDSSGKLDFKTITYIDELPEEYYNLDRIEEEEDDDYGHIPMDDVKKYLSSKMINPQTQAKMKRTNADRIRESIIADNQQELKSNPMAKKLSEKQILAAILLIAKEELFDTGNYPRDAEEATYGDFDDEGASGAKPRARKGSMLAMRQMTDAATGNLLWESNGRPKWELSDDPFIVPDDDEDLEQDESEALQFLDRPAMVDAGHPIPEELLHLFPSDLIQKRVLGGEEVYLVKQPTPIKKPDGTTLYTNEEWLAFQESLSDPDVSFEQAMDNARARRGGKDAGEKRKRLVKLSDMGKALATESGAYIKKAKVLRYLRMLTNADAANPSQTNKDRILAQLRATGQITDSTGGGLTQDLIEVQARKEMAGQEGYESDESEDSAANSEGELGADDRYGEAEVNDDEDDIFLAEEDAADFEGMEDFLGPGSGPTPSPTPGAPAPSKPRRKSVIDDDDDDDDDDEVLPQAGAEPQVPGMADVPMPWGDPPPPTAKAVSNAVDDASKRFSRLAMGNTMGKGRNGH